MQYRLKGRNDFLFSRDEIIAENRGVESLDALRNVSVKAVHSFELLDNIWLGVDMLVKHMNAGSRIHVIQDSDPDGVTSCALSCRYLNDVYDESKITWSVHEKKVHGIILEELEEFQYDLLIVPDAGTNEHEQHEILKERGVDILILDHHPGERSPHENVVTVNPQLDDYPNKNLCGAAVAYKFFKAVDKKLGIDKADEYLDLVAIGLVADMMDSRDLETRYYMQKGIQSIQNKLLKALIEKRAYSIGGELTIHGVAFYITPMINAVCRVGTLDEKKDMLRAFIDDHAVTTYKKRGADQEEIVPLYSDFARQASNIKARQDRLKKKLVPIIMEDERNVSFTTDKIGVMVAECDSALNGLLANEFARAYQKPFLVLNEKEDVGYGGSARGYDTHIIKDFKEAVRGAKIASKAEGHDNAFGVDIPVDKLQDIKDYFNEELDTDLTIVYDVDFILKSKEVSPKFVLSFTKYEGLYGRLFEEPLVAIENVEIKGAEIYKKTSNTISFTCNGVDYVRFKASEEECALVEGSVIKVNLIGRCKTNSYDGKSKPQIVVEEFEVVESTKVDKADVSSWF